MTDTKDNQSHITHEDEVDCVYCYFLYNLIKDHAKQHHMINGLKFKLETGQDILVAVAAHCVHRASQKRERETTEALK